MRRPLPIPVEPLSPQRWAKIERSLFSRWQTELQTDEISHPRPPARWARAPWLGAAALAVAAAIGLFVATRSLNGQAVEHASRITTGVEGSHLVLPGMTLDVEPASTVVIGGASDQGQLIVVDRGSILCDVTPRSAKSPLIVQAGAAQVRVVGTRFRVTRNGGSAQVHVEHGVVEVAQAGVITRLTAGQAWPKVPPALPTVSHVETPPSGTAEPAAGSEVAPGPRRSTRPKLSPLPPRPEPVSVAAAQDKFERAARLERSNPREATELYRELERGTDSWARNALYAHGRLEGARGNKAEARRLLQQYLARFPKGANSADARALLETLR